MGKQLSQKQNAACEKEHAQMETQSSQKQEETDVRINHIIQETLRAEIHFLKAKLTQVIHYRSS